MICHSVKACVLALLGIAGCGELAAPIPGSDPGSAEAPDTRTYDSDPGEEPGSSRKAADDSGQPANPQVDSGTGTGTDATPDNSNESCTTGTVRCSASGMAQECLSGPNGSAWVTINPAAPST